MNKSESKYFNTAVRMDKALLELLQQKDFAYITVREICDAAGVNRSTFYLHYETVSDLLEESLSYIQKQFFMSFQGEHHIISNIKECSKDELMWIKPGYLGPYLKFIRDNRKLYCAVVDHPAIFQLDKTFSQMFHNIFEPILERFSVPVEERHYRIIFYLEGISGIIKEWIKNKCEKPIEKMITVICNCIPQN